MPHEAAPFLNWGIGICTVMAVVWAFRVKSKGPRAIVMLTAFLVFGLFMFLLRLQSPTWTRAVSGAVLFVLLVTDVLMRRKQGASE